jgi:hypothetical protein
VSQIVPYPLRTSANGMSPPVIFSVIAQDSLAAG